MHDRIRVCQWGTFDAVNYGDQIFPLVAREQLTARIPNLDLVCFAPVGHAALPAGSPSLFPLVPGGGPLDPQRRGYFAEHFDAILVGGGDLLRFDRTEPAYDDLRWKAPARPYDPFLDFGWGSTRPAILWNAPGVPFPFEPERRLLVQRAFSYVDYAAVRDEMSRGYLLEAGVDGPIEIVPDTGVLLAETIRSHVGVDPKVARFRDRDGGRDHSGRLCFQCSPGFLRRQAEPVAASLARIGKRHNLEIVLLPIGLCHGDLEALRSVHDASGGRFTLVEDIETPLEIGAVVGSSDYFVGSSLHGSLTALSFGTPHLVVNNPLRSAKLEGYVQLADLEDFRISTWEDLEPCFEGLAATPRKRWVETAAALKARAGDHFDRLADLILRSAAEVRGAGGNQVGNTRPTDTYSPRRLPPEVYGTIARLHEQLDDERAARRATEKELERSGEVIYERHHAHVAQLERSEVRQQRLRGQVHDLETRNEALENRLREMENSTAWRMLGPYRRLRTLLKGRNKGR